MAKIHAYLNFNGNCEEAFKFYEQVFQKNNLGIHRFGDMPADPNFPMNEKDKNKVLHTAIFINDDTMLMGSDTMEQYGQKAVTGTSTYVMLDAESADEARKLFDALSQDALNMEMELGETFFAELFASFQDKFGIAWMIHFEGNKKFD